MAAFWRVSCTIENDFSSGLVPGSSRTRTDRRGTVYSTLRLENTP
jgi:hypothetical protein